jgi:two-component system LytT family sensor kinase
VVFLRHSAEAALGALRGTGSPNSSEDAMLQAAISVFGTTFSAARAEIAAEPPTGADLSSAVPVLDSAACGCPPWVRAIVPLRFSRGDVHYFMLGARSGGRRYLSEDIALLDRMASVIGERIEQARHIEMQSLVSHAELRALQAQINPHFFFNALNTLYGVIPRESAPARRLVLNLAELFRMSFSSERTLIRIEEEVRIVRAYLEIEQLRLGRKLTSKIDVDDNALHVEVPVLSIQPLVENAVKHGVASRAGGGFVHLAIRAEQDIVTVSVSNSGGFAADDGRTRGNGVGLGNVRQRLVLCFGRDGELTVSGTGDETTVRFSVPVRSQSDHRDIVTA